MAKNSREEAAKDLAGLFKWGGAGVTLLAVSRVFGLNKAVSPDQIQWLQRQVNVLITEFPAVFNGVVQTINIWWLRLPRDL